MTETAYSTDNPETVAAFLEAAHAVRDFSRKICSDAAELGNNKGPLRSGGVVFGDIDTVGLAADDPENPPTGWIYSKAKDYLVPRRGKAGDVARQWLADHKPPQDSRKVLAEHGLPFNDMLGPADGMSQRFSVPVVFEHDGTLWALYRGTPGLWFGGDNQPECTWTSRKLSEYHAAREAFETAKSDEKVAI